MSLSKGKKHCGASDSFTIHLVESQMSAHVSLPSQGLPIPDFQHLSLRASASSKEISTECQLAGRPFLCQVTHFSSVLSKVTPGRKHGP